jgi:cation diffusion facilitator CzcD-associated flavoprotein CzcO
MRRIDRGLAVMVRPPDGGRPFEVTADRVALATGNRPRRPSPEWGDRARTYDEVYAEVLRGDVARYTGRSVVIVGSGNSALQTAALLANHASDVTILANHYPGLYPLETTDRFAWRSASHLTYELVVKGGEQCGRPGSIPCVRFVVYRSLTRGHDGTVVFDYAATDNRHRIGASSLPPRCAHAAQAMPWPAGGGWTERRSPDTELVWATGSDPQYPDAALLAALPRDERGFIVHDEDGATPVPGLFVVGSCAGARSVNEMRPVVFAEVVQQAGGRSLGQALEPGYA